MNISTRILKFYFTRTPRPIIQCTKYTNLLDLTRLDRLNGEIDATVIVNNLLNIQWLEKGVKTSKHIVVADGGANRLYNTAFRDSEKLLSIVGDLDSINDHVKQYYLSKNIQVYDYKDQNINDFQKAFTKCIDKNLNKIICFGAFGGRMDHTLSAMSSTSKLCQKYSSLQILLVGRQNLIYYLRPKIKHVIKICENISLSGCGIVRFGSRVKVQTSGFKWNLGEKYEFSTLEWGKFISSSNQIVDTELKIESEGELYLVLHLKMNKH